MWSDALAAYEECLEIREDAWGVEHPLTIEVRSNIGHMYGLIGKKQRAKEYFNVNMEVLQRKQAQEREEHGAAVKDDI